MMGIAHATIRITHFRDVYITKEIEITHNITYCSKEHIIARRRAHFISVVAQVTTKTLTACEHQSMRKFKQPVTIKVKENGHTV